MDVSQILPRLFVGSYPEGPDEVQRLRRRFGVAAALCLQTDDDLQYRGLRWPQVAGWYDAAGIEVRRVPVRDFDQDDLRRRLADCVRALDELLRQGHTVYLHCNVGMGRSPAVAVAYLHWISRWDLDRAAGHVTSCRVCSPNLEAVRLAGADRGEAE